MKENSGKLRVGTIINVDENNESKSLINHLIIAALRTLPVDTALDTVKEIIKDFPAIEAGIRSFSDYGITIVSS